jgi:hypothetical protein
MKKVKTTLKQLTPVPYERIAGYYRMWLETDMSVGRTTWIMHKSKGTLNPSMVMTFLNGWDRFRAGKPEPGVNESDALRAGYAEASRDAASSMESSKICTPESKADSQDETGLTK